MTLEEAKKHPLWDAFVAVHKEMYVHSPIHTTPTKFEYWYLLKATPVLFDMFIAGAKAGAILATQRFARENAEVHAWIDGINT